jgi:hypothetical protein
MGFPGSQSHAQQKHMLWTFHDTGCARTAFGVHGDQRRHKDDHYGGVQFNRTQICCRSALVGDEDISEESDSEEESELSEDISWVAWCSLLHLTRRG